MSSKTTRREFLKTGMTLVTVPYFVPGRALGVENVPAPSERIVMGNIGIGSMGGGHLHGWLGHNDVQVTAVCDLREAFRQRAKRMVDEKYGHQDCHMYHDFRELLARPDIDAVCIATPDHWHALVSIEAAKNGKDMYQEKPADIHVAAAKALREAVNRYGVVFQFGTQQRSSRDFRFACELARNGRVWASSTRSSSARSLGPRSPTSRFSRNRIRRFSTTICGSAPPRGRPTLFNVPPRGPKVRRATGCTSTTTASAVSAAPGASTTSTSPNGLTARMTRVRLKSRAAGVLPKDGLCDTPVTWRVEHLYANGVKMIHMDSRHTEGEFPQFKNPILPQRGCGVLLIGSDGWVLVSRGGIDASPKSLLQETFGPGDIRLGREQPSQTKLPSVRQNPPANRLPRRRRRSFRHDLPSR